jgi:hypothetical protein
LRFPVLPVVLPVMMTKVVLSIFDSLHEATPRESMSTGIAIVDCVVLLRTVNLLAGAV